MTDKITLRQGIILNAIQEFDVFSDLNQEDLNHLLLLVKEYSGEALVEALALELRGNIQFPIEELEARLQQWKTFNP